MNVKFLTEKPLLEMKRELTKRDLLYAHRVKPDMQEIYISMVDYSMPTMIDLSGELSHELSNEI